MTKPRYTRRRILEREGFVFVSGWLPASADITQRAQAQIEHWRDDVEKIVDDAEPGEPGRPAKTSN